MYRNIKYFSTTLFLVLFGVSFAFAKGLQTELSVNNSEPLIGDTVVVNISVKPDLGYPIYTVSQTLNYDPEALQLVDANLTDSWFSANKPPYWLRDVENGEITLTGGYPQGTDLPTSFANFTFKAKKSGNTRLFTNKGFSYDSANVRNTLSNQHIYLNISDVSSTPTDGDIPNDFQNITSMKIFGSGIAYLGEDYEFLAIHPKTDDSTTSLIGVITVVDPNNMVLFTKHLTIPGGIDDTQNVTIPKNVLSTGDYKILFSVNYDGINGQSVSKDFSVVKKGYFDRNIVSINLVYILIILVLIYIILKLLEIIHRKVAQRKQLLAKIRREKN